MTSDAVLARELRARGLELIRMGEAMVRQAAAAVGQVADDRVSSDETPDVVQVARTAYHDRQLRSAYFRSDLFGEPAWNMLLDLFIRERAGHHTSVKAACLGSGAAKTTALRYISLLIDEGLIQREEDPEDGRRTWLTLSPAAAEMMTRYLEAKRDRARFANRNDRAA
jgi:hypothetical protein